MHSNTLNGIKGAVVTGATGAVGTALVKELIQNNVRVLVLCREGSNRNSSIPESPLVARRFCSLSQLSAIQNDTGETYDVFYHLAWEGTTGPARNDRNLQNHNLLYSLEAVKAAKRFGCHAFIGAGSQAEYGRSNRPLTPHTSTKPETEYGIAKQRAGDMTRALAHDIGLRHVWVRILSVYGPNDGSGSMVMSTIDKLLRGETPQFTKAEQIWDYLYSGDAAKALYLLGEHGLDGKTYVLGSGEGRPLADYIRDIRDAVAPGAELAIGSIDYSPNQVMYLKADIRALTHDTGWMPETPFKEGIKAILESKGI